MSAVAGGGFESSDRSTRPAHRSGQSSGACTSSCAYTSYADTRRVQTGDIGNTPTSIRSDVPLVIIP